MLARDARPEPVSRTFTCAVTACRPSKLKKLLLATVNSPVLAVMANAAGVSLAATFSVTNAKDRFSASDCTLITPNAISFIGFSSIVISKGSISIDSTTLLILIRMLAVSDTFPIVA